eukprot:TRINITY_DN18308_c0_g1_i1.p1 TRINITY_DN18308_c0_g1~~TRINITY_DN18308_c0_g1_i1.p1  ORF type:complete len:771 (-),score=154.10 TRINITY_DN18308_c0_g1_i1:142-2454(-)
MTQQQQHQQWQQQQQQLQPQQRQPLSHRREQQEYQHEQQPQQSQLSEQPEQPCHTLPEQHIQTTQSHTSRVSSRLQVDEQQQDSQKQQDISGLPGQEHLQLQEQGRALKDQKQQSRFEFVESGVQQLRDEELSEERSCQLQKQEDEQLLHQEQQESQEKQQQGKPSAQQGTSPLPVHHLQKQLSKSQQHQKYPHSQQSGLDSKQHQHPQHQQQLQQQQQHTLRGSADHSAAPKKTIRPAGASTPSPRRSFSRRSPEVPSPPTRRPPGVAPQFQVQSQQRSLSQVQRAQRQNEHQVRLQPQSQHRVLQVEEQQQHQLEAQEQQQQRQQQQQQQPEPEPRSQSQQQQHQEQQNQQQSQQQHIVPQWPQHCLQQHDSIMQSFEIFTPESGTTIPSPQQQEHQQLDSQHPQADTVTLRLNLAELLASAERSRQPQREHEATETSVAAASATSTTARTTETTHPSTLSQQHPAAEQRGIPERKTSMQHPNIARCVSPEISHVNRSSSRSPNNWSPSAVKWSPSQVFSPSASSTPSRRFLQDESCLDAPGNALLVEPTTINYNLQPHNQNMKSPRRAKKHPQHGSTVAASAGVAPLHHDAGDDDDFLWNLSAQYSFEIDGVGVERRQNSPIFVPRQRRSQSLGRSSSTESSGLHRATGARSLSPSLPARRPDATDLETLASSHQEARCKEARSRTTSRSVSQSSSCQGTPHRLGGRSTSPEHRPNTLTPVVVAREKPVAGPPIDGPPHIQIQANSKTCPLVVGSCDVEEDISEESV